jgi:hypothetical protein
VAVFLPTQVVLAQGRLIDGLNGLAQGQWRVYTRDGELRGVVRTWFCGSDAAWSPDGQWFALGDQFVDCT